MCYIQKWLCILWMQIIDRDWIKRRPRNNRDRGFHVLHFIVQNHDSTSFTVICNDTLYGCTSLKEAVLTTACRQVTARHSASVVCWSAYQFHQLQPPSLWMHSRVPLYWGMSQSRQNPSWSKKHHLTRLSLPCQIWELLLIWWCKDLMSCLYTDFVLSITHPMTFNQWTTLHLKGLIKPSTSFQHTDFNKLPRNDGPSYFSVLI